MSDDAGAAGPSELTTSIAPWLAVGDGAAALAFYRAAFGATEVFPVGDGNGWHVGRVSDPFGHQWEIGRPLAG
ncbi:MAG TPA: hypothetical protein VE132_13935 [Micromonosporaceae bacterium]|nr:hypothetical protein [Micromonosporaceae bacterium]